MYEIDQYSISTVYDHKIRRWKEKEDQYDTVTYDAIITMSVNRASLIRRCPPRNWLTRVDSVLAYANRYRVRDSAITWEAETQR